MAEDAIQQWADAGQPYLIGGWIAGLTILSGRLLFGIVGAEAAPSRTPARLGRFGRPCRRACRDGWA